MKHKGHVVQRRLKGQKFQNMEPFTIYDIYNIKDGEIKEKIDHGTKTR